MSKVKVSKVSYGSDRVTSPQGKGKVISRRWAELIALTLLLVVLGLAGLDKVMERGERAECLAWKEQASQNSTFYLVGWQADQCKSVGVPMKGIPVRG